ncbi:MAG: LAGLIDADG family homing endonuclease [Candidatus Nanohalobium sp.]
MKKLEIPEDELREFYIKEEMSSNEIAEEYGCSKRTILERLREYDIPRRSSGPKRRDDITKEKLEKLYVVEELSTRDIAEKLDTGRSTVYNKLKKFDIPTRDISKSHIKYERKDFSGESEEKNYLLGFCIGDLRARKIGKKSKTIKVDCGSTKEAQIKLFKDLFDEYGHVWEGGPYEDGSKHVEAFLNESFEFLLNARDDLVLPEKEEDFLAFLTGFIDAEGSFFITNGKAKFALGNYDEEMLKMLKSRLEDLGVQATQIYTNEERYDIEGKYERNDSYKLFQINRKDSLLKITEMISDYTKHRDKKNDIEKIRENISGRNR